MDQRASRYLGHVESMDECLVVRVVLNAEKVECEYSVDRGLKEDMSRREMTVKA